MTHCFHSGAVEYTACWKRYGVPKPRIVESDQVQLQFDF